jgi:hypothetical protein
MGPGQLSYQRYDNLFFEDLIMRLKFFSLNELPYSMTNCRDTVTTIFWPYSARASPKISLHMRCPTCQYSEVREVLTVLAIDCRVYLSYAEALQEVRMASLRWLKIPEWRGVF